MSGTGRIGDAFAAARDEGRAALMPYLMGGFPDPETSTRVIEAYVESGADLIELGVPFSDPLADGPVIHSAATKALESGATYERVREIARAVSDHVPVIAMVYANMVFARPPEQFAHELADAGVAGAIVPDLPPEEAGGVSDALAEAGLALVPLVAPTTPATRRREICGAATGFVYVVSDTRTTGERDEMPAELAEQVEAVKADSPVPAAVGFGIGTPEQAAEVGRIADGVIVGSRLVREVAEAENAEGAAEAVGAFISDARDAMASGRLPA